DAGDNGRFTKSGVDAILANMYLNAGVFTKDSAGVGGISATTYNSCAGIPVSGNPDACQAALAAANRILNSGYYRLADSFPQNFRADNYKSPENIFVVKFIAADGLGRRGGPDLQVAGRPGPHYAKQWQRLRLVPPGRDLSDQGRNRKRAGERSSGDGTGRQPAGPARHRRSAPRHRQSRRDPQGAAVRIAGRRQAAAGLDPVRRLHDPRG